MARVLVVDDAAFMRKVVSDALAAGGHEVVGEGANGVEAVARFQELRPDLTMLDITMPEKTGLEALKLGAKNFLVKPFKAEQLQEAVDKALA